MHINEVFSILKDCLSEKDDSFDVKAYNDGYNIDGNFKFLHYAVSVMRKCLEEAVAKK